MVVLAEVDRAKLRSSSDSEATVCSDDKCQGWKEKDNFGKLARPSYGVIS
jgi:hypothetical protein